MYGNGQFVTAPELATVLPGNSSGWWLQLAVGGSWACGIDWAGAAFCWGVNDVRNASLGDAAGSTNSKIPVQVQGAGGGRWARLSMNGQTACGIKYGGSGLGMSTLWCW